MKVDKDVLEVVAIILIGIILLFGNFIFINWLLPSTPLWIIGRVLIPIICFVFEMMIVFNFMVEENS